MRCNSTGEGSSRQAIKKIVSQEKDWIGGNRSGIIWSMAIDLTPRGNERCLKTSVSLPRDIQQEAREVAIQHGISLSEYLARLLRTDLEERHLGKKA